MAARGRTRTALGCDGHESRRSVPGLALYVVLLLSAFAVAGRTLHAFKPPPAPPVRALTGAELPQPAVISADEKRKTLDSGLVMGIAYWSYEYAATPNGQPCTPFTCLPAPRTRLTLYTGTIPASAPDYFNLPDNRVAVRLRSYAYPRDPQEYARLDDAGRRRYLADAANLVWSKPGPTFRLRHGDQFNLKLINRLPVEADPYTHDCHDVGGDDTGDAPDDAAEGGREQDKPPNCFHGDNTLNIHYHGLRGSPQRPQDWVFLELKPAGTPPPPSDYEHRDNVVIGEYDSHLDPISKLQSAGTFWYHPHKHGASFLQVLNGMAGGFLVRGDFDESLERQLPGLQEKLLVLQELRPALRPKVTNEFSGAFWVNGVWNPVVSMAPGEIQRWRFVNTGLAAISLVRLHFKDANVAMRQIAQDGVPFAQANYVRQPLNLDNPEGIWKPSFYDWRGASPQTVSAANSDEVDHEKAASFHMAPANRIDLLVKAPDWDPAAPLKVDPVTKEEYQDYVLLSTKLWAVKPKKKKAAPATGPAPTSKKSPTAELLTLRVVRTKKGGAKGRLMAVTLPPLPEWLRDIQPEPQKRRTFSFSMENGPFINSKKYDPHHIDETVKVGDTEQWVFRNVSPEPHPFHIHVNPFQVTHMNGKDLPRPWVWFDTTALPVQKDGATPSDGPTPGDLVIHQRYLEFAGDYVLHCHILGHNDRGMMKNVRAHK